MATQFLTFAVSDLEVGLDIQHVAQIIEYVEPAPVPHLPPAIRGVINLRGKVVPVVDLGRKLARPERAVTRRTCIVVVEAREAGVLGIVADLVHDLIEVGDGEVLPVPGFGLPVREDYLLGLARARGTLALLLDSAKVLSPEELLAAAEAARPAEATT
jgi:purine-binding chemotaxis protein CheW